MEQFDVPRLTKYHDDYADDCTPFIVHVRRYRVFLQALQFFCDLGHCDGKRFPPLRVDAL